MPSNFVVKFKTLLSNPNGKLLCFLITIAGIRALHHGPYLTKFYMCHGGNFNLVCCYLSFIYPKGLSFSPVNVNVGTLFGPPRKHKLTPPPSVLSW